jgi:tRNA modification GTPase
VRLSGPEAVAVAERLVDLRAPLQHARAVFARVLDPGEAEKQIPCGDDNQKSKNTIDEAVVTAFFAPHSYTGEDVVEIAAHGSPVVLEALVRAAITSGAKATLSFGESTDGLKSVPFKTARLAAPGEFTQRAFLSGRIDLTQAEAVADLIAAQTLDQARAAAQQLGGALSRRVAPAKEALLHLIALLEAGMDFASGELDDVDVVPPAQIALSIDTATAPLTALAASFRRGQLLRSGAAIALVGRPNAGKSSLFNRLLQRDRAIVTALPGTTRDTVEESLSLGGVPVRLVDTAGLRLGNTMDEAEQQGIARSREALADADLVLLVRDATLAPSDEELALQEELAVRPHLIIKNKIDLIAQMPGAKAPVLGGADRGLKPAATPGVEVGFSPPLDGLNEGALAPAAVSTSALTGQGIDDLRAAVLRELGAAGSLAEAGLLNNLRQQEAITTALTALAAAAESNQNALPHEIILLELHTALRSLDSLTGQTTTDDILGHIFATFCIGK